MEGLQNTVEVHLPVELVGVLLAALDVLVGRSVDLNSVLAVTDVAAVASVSEATMAVIEVRMLAPDLVDKMSILTNTVDVLIIHGISKEFLVSSTTGAARVAELVFIVKSVVHLTGSVRILNLGNIQHSSKVSLIAATTSH